MINHVTGTEDHLDLRLRNHIIGTLKKYLELYNFQEIQTPILEYTQLFIRSLGEGTDVVSKEMYVFAQDQEKSVCLRPEATASTIRACVENKIARFPWKTFTVGPMFRRERPQKGRLRQFWQVSIECIGSQSVQQDARIIKMLDIIFEQGLQLGRYTLYLNFLGCQEDRKNHREKLIEFLNSCGSALCATCLQRKDTNTLRVFDCKQEACQKQFEKAPKPTEHLCHACTEQWQTLQTSLKLLGVNFVVNPKLVRGLDYYHKTVFEFSSLELGAQNTFCGGGSYHLGQEMGAKEDFQCVGAAIGIERLELLLAEKGSQLPDKRPPLNTIIPLTAQQDQLALLLSQQLLENGLRTEVILDKASVTNMMKKANNSGSRVVIVIGQQEQENNVAMVKNMETGKTDEVKQSNLVSFLKSNQ